MTKTKPVHFSNVFKISAFATSILIILALIFPEYLTKITGDMRRFLGTHFGWFYLLIATIVVGVCIYFILSPLGKIRLGESGDKPEYSTTTWLAMLFSAGMGIGLVFYGAAEPLSHYAISAPDSQVLSAKALEDSLKYSFFHYGIHAWAIYAIVALALAYFQFRKKEKTLVSVTLKPLLGNRANGAIGTSIDCLTIIATTIGVATTLGFGATQINGGLNYLFGIPEDFIVQLIIILIASVLFIWSAVSGIDKGISIISNLNILISVILMTVIILMGPTVKIMNSTLESIGVYINNFITLSFRTEAFNPSGQAWIQKWTIMYWAWWISWSPFVGIFIARISKGRTIREFLVYVLLIPTIFSCLWFAVFGVLSTDAVQIDPSLTALPTEKILFGVFHNYPMGLILSIVAIILVFSFFITSANSATVVLAMESENGSLKPKKSTKLVWGCLLSLISIALLLAGGLDALQNIMIIIAFPFAFIIILIVISLMKELHYEQKKMGLYIKPNHLPKKDEPFKSYEEE